MNRSFVYTFILTLAATYATFFYVEKTHRHPASLPIASDDISVQFESPDAAPASMQHFSYDYSDKLYNSANFNNQRLLMIQQQLETQYQDSQRNKPLAYSRKRTNPTAYLQRNQEDMRLRRDLWLIRSQRTQNFSTAFMATAPVLKKARYNAKWYNNRRRELEREKRIIETNLVRLDRNKDENSTMIKNYEKEIAILDRRIAYVTQKGQIEAQKANALTARLDEIRWQMATVNSDPYSLYGMPSLEMAALQAENEYALEPTIKDEALATNDTNASLIDGSTEQEIEIITEPAVDISQ